MDMKNVVRGSLARSRMVTSMLLDDMSDPELLVRPADGANHIAWQLGHLIGAENNFGEAIKEGSMPKLPEGFNEKHTKERASSNEGFLRKVEYLRLYDAQRAALLATLESISDAELEQPSPEGLARIAPKKADLFQFAADHEMMHTGQYSTVRRKLGKPVIV